MCVMVTCARYLLERLAHRLGLWLLLRLALSAGEFTWSRLQSLKKGNKAEINISYPVINVPCVGE